MSSAEARYPSWREYPSAVSEAVFFVTSTQGSEGPTGKFRYEGVHEFGDETMIRVKGDFIADFDYAVFSTMVFEELLDVLATRVDARAFEAGDMLARFVAFKRTDEWSIEVGEGAVERAIRQASFEHLDVEGDEPVTIEEAIRQADEETLEEIRNLFDEE